jgi:hypothetical protein
MNTVKYKMSHHTSWYELTKEELENDCNAFLLKDKKYSEETNYSYLGKTITISSGTNYKEAAKKLLEFLTVTEREKKIEKL